MYSADRTVKDLGDKVTDDDRKAIDDAKKRLSEVVSGDDVQAIKDALEQLSKAVHDLTTRAYQAGQAAGGSADGTDAGDSQTSDDGKTVDGEYTVSDDDGKRGA